MINHNQNEQGDKNMQPYKKWPCHDMRSKHISWDTYSCQVWTDGCAAVHFWSESLRMHVDAKYEQPTVLKSWVHWYLLISYVYGPFSLSSISATSCGSGNYYGTLSGPIEAMSPLAVARKAHRSPGRNIVTSNPKKGSGYRFMARTLSNVVHECLTSHILTLCFSYSSGTAATTGVVCILQLAIIKHLKMLHLFDYLTPVLGHFLISSEPMNPVSMHFLGM